MAEEGIDVNGAKGPVGWPQVAASGKRFAIVKATEGATFKDARFQQHRRAAAAAGLHVGAYHFARPHGNTPKAEAANFLAAYGAGTELPVLDFEDDQVAGGARLGDWVAAWLAEVERRTGRTPLLYTFTSYWRAHGSTDSKFSRYPLWLADYDGPYTVPAPWSRLTLHQFTSSGSVPGVGGRVDINRFDGTPEQLAALFHPEHQEDDMTDDDRQMLREVHEAIKVGVPTMGVPPMQTASTVTYYGVAGIDLDGHPSLLRRIAAKLGL